MENVLLRIFMYQLAVALIAVGFLFLPQVSFPREHPGVNENVPDSVFQVGEELTYNVSYGSFDIGRVRIKLLEVITRDHATSYKASAYIDSYKGIPFVNLHAVYFSMIDQASYSTWFNARTKDDERWKEWTYVFDYPKSSLFIEEGIWKSIPIARRDTLHLDTLSQDGLSLFFLARKNVFCRQVMMIPTIVKEKKGNTLINFTVEHGNEEIEAVQYPVDVVHFEGDAKFVGVFGLTGGFEGWFSNDAARVPILAKMKVLIGNIRIELTEWKRTGWVPPRFVEKKKQ